MADAKLSSLAQTTPTADGSDVAIVIKGGVVYRVALSDIAQLATTVGGAAVPGRLAGINDQVGTAYTLSASDAGKDVRCSNAAAIGVTIPKNSDVAIPIGWYCLVSQGAAGSITVAAGTGVTLLAPNGVSTTAKGDLRGLEKTDIDTWRVI